MAPKQTDAQPREQRGRTAKRDIRAMSRQTLENIAFAAWQYHQQTNVVCSVHDIGDDGAECICDWINETRKRADDALHDLLP